MASSIARTCAPTASIRGRAVTTARLQPAKAAFPTQRLGPAKKALRLKPCTATEAVDGCSTDADNFDGCSLADLELMYVDALWNFYHPTTKGQFTMSDDAFDRLKDELYWQGSGFPTLRKEEIEFVEASLAYARGKPVMSDEEYEVLKQNVQSKGEKRADVTALLLYTKGRQLLEPEEYDLLAGEMQKLGIEVGLRGAACTLSKTPDDLKTDVESLVKMYAGLGAIPTTIGVTGTLLLSLLFGGPTITPQSLLFSIGVGAVVTVQLARYLDLHNSQVLIGQCPCCETELKQFFGGENPVDTVTKKCSVCGTTVDINRQTKKVALSAGPEYINA